MDYFTFSVRIQPKFSEFNSCLDLYGRYRSDWDYKLELYVVLHNAVYYISMMFACRQLMSFSSSENDDDDLNQSLIDGEETKKNSTISLNTLDLDSTTLDDSSESTIKEETNSTIIDDDQTQFQSTLSSENQAGLTQPVVGANQSKYIIGDNLTATIGELSSIHGMSQHIIMRDEKIEPSILKLIQEVINEKNRAL